MEWTEIKRDMTWDVEKILGPYGKDEGRQKGGLKSGLLNPE